MRETFVCSFNNTCTLCACAQVRCTPVASPVDNFVEIASPVPNYASPANEYKFFLNR